MRPFPRLGRVTPRVRRGGRVHAAGLLAVGAAGLIILSACADATSPDAPSSDTASSDTAPTVDFGITSGPTPGMVGHGSMPAASPVTPGASPAPVGAAPAAATAVQIDNFAFTPATLTVPVGTAVTWTNHDEEPHNVAASDGSFHSPGMGTGATYTYTFATAGTFDYTCTIHPFMHATVVVTR